MKKEYMKAFFTVLCLSVLAAACRSSKSTAQVPEVGQGIKGQVLEISGNAMPSPDVPAPRGKAVKTMVYVYEATHVGQTDRIGTSPTYKSIRTKLVQTVETGKDGRFSIALPPGNYSLFTRVGDLYYANSFDAKNNIAPVTVAENKLTEVNITVSPAAHF